MSAGQLFRYLLAVAAGLLPAFFVVFNAIFSDVFSLPERLLTFALTLIAYGIVGAAFGFVSPRDHWEWATALVLPAAVLVIWYSLNEGRWLLHLAYVLVALGGAAAGAYLGARLRARSRRQPSG